MTRKWTSSRFGKRLVGKVALILFVFSGLIIIWPWPNSAKVTFRKVFTTSADFDPGGVRQGVRIGKESVVLSKYGRKIRSYSQPGAISVWGDPTTGDIYLPTYKMTATPASPESRGLVILYADGTAAAYRIDGVWDVTGDITGIGTLIRPDLHIGSYRTRHAWKEVETGDIYLSTYKGGINIIHTQNTRDYSDDTIDVISGMTSPGIFMQSPVHSWKDEERNLYVGFYQGGAITIVHPDGTSTSYTLNGVFDTTRKVDYQWELTRTTPRLGALDAGNRGYTIPCLKDRDGNLYVIIPGSGLTVLRWNADLDMYDISLTYREDGLYDTTEDNVGTLIDSDRRIPSIGISDVWEEKNGDIYVSCFDLSSYEQVGSIIHPDGSVTVPARFGWHRWKDGTGDIYVSEGDLKIIHSDGSVSMYDVIAHPGGARESWIDVYGQVYIVGYLGQEITVIASNREGTFTSRAVDVGGGAAIFSWQADVPRGTTLAMQTRTGAPASYWIEIFEDTTSGFLSHHIIIEEAEGILQFSTSGTYDKLEWLTDTGQRFPEGSVIRAKVRLTSELGGRSLKLVAGASEAEFTVVDSWNVLSYRASGAFSKVGLSSSILSGERIELDWISVESSVGWTEWVKMQNGAAIPNVDVDHPLVQWRAQLSSSDPPNAVPALDEVEITYDLTTEVEDRPRDPLPQASSLNQNYPNPFNAETTIIYNVAKTSTVRLSVYALNGELVRTLIHGERSAGRYSVVWDGRDDAGREMASGMYVCWIVAGDYSAVRKMLLVR